MVGDITYHKAKEDRAETFKGRVNFTKLSLLQKTHVTDSNTRHIVIRRSNQMNTLKCKL